MCKICFGGVTDPPLHKHTPAFFAVCISVVLPYTNRIPHHACRIPRIWNLSLSLSWVNISKLTTKTFPSSYKNRQVNNMDEYNLELIYGDES